jgi:hypothetical protein
MSPQAKRATHNPVDGYTEKHFHLVVTHYACFVILVCIICLHRYGTGSRPGYKFKVVIDYRAVEMRYAAQYILTACPCCNASSLKSGFCRPVQLDISSGYGGMLQACAQGSDVDWQEKWLTQKSGQLHHAPTGAIMM